MKQTLIIPAASFIFLLEFAALANTKILLHDATSPVGTVATAGNGIGGCVSGTNDSVWRLATTTQGAALVTQAFKPTATAPPCYMQTASGGGQFLMWLTPPISTAVTISGNIDYNVYCKESSGAMNGAISFVVKKWAKGGLVSTVMTSANAVECTIAGANFPIAAAAPTSTSFAIGDRIAIFILVNNGAAWGGNGARTLTVGYDRTAGGNGDTFVDLVDAVSFSADSNTAPAFVQ